MLYHIIDCRTVLVGALISRLECADWVPRKRETYHICRCCIYIYIYTYMVISASRGSPTGDPLGLSGSLEVTNGGSQEGPANTRYELSRGSARSAPRPPRAECRSRCPMLPYVGEKRRQGCPSAQTQRRTTLRPRWNPTTSHRIPVEPCEAQRKATQRPVWGTWFPKTPSALSRVCCKALVCLPKARPGSPRSSSEVASRPPHRPALEIYTCLSMGLVLPGALYICFGVFTLCLLMTKP